MISVSNKAESAASIIPLTSHRSCVASIIRCWTSCNLPKTVSFTSIVFIIARSFALLLQTILSAFLRDSKAVLSLLVLGRTHRAHSEAYESCSVDLSRQFPNRVLYHSLLSPPLFDRSTYTLNDLFFILNPVSLVASCWGVSDPILSCLWFLLVYRHNSLGRHSCSTFQVYTNWHIQNLSILTPNQQKKSK